MSERYYVNLPLAPGSFTLDGPEAHHLVAVCRLRPDDRICLFNGDGHEYPARITHTQRREVQLEIVGVETPRRELPFTLEVAAPLPKGDRAQILIEKLTELGVSRFVPIESQYATMHPRDTKRDKLERWVIEASKQCGRNKLMAIADLMKWKDHCESGADGELRILAHPDSNRTMAELNQAAQDAGVRRVAVGPEGGFTADEVALAIAHSWQAVHLGSRILRVETAAIVLAAAMGLATHMNHRDTEAQRKAE